MRYVRMSLRQQHYNKNRFKTNQAKYKKYNCIITHMRVNSCDNYIINR